MILKMLEKLGRKKIVLDRGPSHPEFHKAKPWMERYYLLFRKRPKWFPFNILIHKMLDDDHGEGVHNHLCPYITIILKGGYWETTKKGKFWRPPGYIGFRSADHLHRVDLKPNTNTMTLAFMVINLVKLVPYYYVGLLAPSNLMISLYLLPLAFISVLIGYFVQKRIPEKLFFNIVYVLLFLSGCKLIYDGII